MAEEESHWVGPIRVTPGEGDEITVGLGGPRPQRVPWGDGTYIETDRWGQPLKPKIELKFGGENTVGHRFKQWILSLLRIKGPDATLRTIAKEPDESFSSPTPTDQK